MHNNNSSLCLKGYTGLAEAIENWDFSKLEKLELHRQLLKRIEATMLEVDPVAVMPYINTCLIERECAEILQVWLTVKSWYLPGFAAEKCWLPGLWDELQSIRQAAE